MKEQKKQQFTSAEHGIYEISAEDLDLVIGGAVEHHLTLSPQRPRHLVKQSSGLYLDPSRNNPTAGDLYDKNGKHVGIAIGNCSAGPC